MSVESEFDKLAPDLQRIDEINIILNKLKQLEKRLRQTNKMYEIESIKAEALALGELLDGRK